MTWPAAWTTNAFAREAAHLMVECLEKAYPRRVILEPIPFVRVKFCAHPVLSDNPWL